MGLEGKNAIITGGARGIGRAIAETLAQRGAQLVIADRELTLAETTAKEIAAACGVQAIAIPVDVSNGNSAKEMVDQSLASMGHIDILVNNAGVTRDNLLMRMSEDEWDTVLNINLKGAFNCSKAVIRSMMKQRYGRIVSVSSVSGLVGQAGQANYSASKAGVIGFTKAIAREVASRGITVNAVAPGLVPTTLTADLPEDVRDYIIKVTPMARLGKPEEIAYAVAFLASDEAAYITGQVIAVDGGMTMV